MGLLYPAGLFLLASIPVLAIAYMVRERPQRLIVSSVIAFRALGGLKGDRPWGLPKLDWMFFIEALILALAALALAGPYVIRRRNPIAVVLDNSAAMQALAPSGRLRFEEARDQLAAALRSEGSGGEVSVYSTAPLPRLIAGPLPSIAAAESAINRIALTDSPDDTGAVERNLADLGSGKRFSRVIFAGSRPLSPPFPDRIRAITIDDPIPNFALGSFVLRRESLGADVLHGRVTIANFSSRATTLVVDIDGDGKRLAYAQARLEPRELGALDFPSLAPASSYRANLAPKDGFDLDNVAYATASAARSIEILFVTPTPSDAASLNSLPGVHVLSQRPENYQPDQAAKADLVIFEYTVPKDLPPTNALLVMPPQGDRVFRFDAYSASNVQITGWKAPDPLTDG
ncbi:MAG TPA: BatA domain-containing protein, partial [Candidatus Binataceae bacterium]